MALHAIKKPFYPIVYVRGYAMTKAEREDTFYDSYYGFAANSVERRNAPPPEYFQADVFEGQLIRFMKLGDYRYADASNAGIEDFDDNPSRSIWVCRFYDQDFFTGKIRDIMDHAKELKDLIVKKIPSQLEPHVALGDNNEDYKVILIAHSMGGLVCRTLIQNIFPAANEDPKRWIHRFVTMGTPHAGIDLGLIPDFVERLSAEHLNPFDSGIFTPSRMRKYLNLEDKYDVYSLGEAPQPEVPNLRFPVKRCLCLIGSNYKEYNTVQWLTGDHSDGLVKQSNAYCVGGEKPSSAASQGTPATATGQQQMNQYPDEQVAFYANVHRAHSGRVGIVNSYESFENIHRFLFGDIMARVFLNKLAIHTPVEPGSEYFYDVEFLFSVRRTGVYLHRRQQDPCENAWRFDRSAIPGSLLLHTGFMNSKLNTKEKGKPSPFSYSSLQLVVIERRRKNGLLWDKEYPARQIYNETLEIRVGGVDAGHTTELGFRWLSDGQDFIAKPETADGSSTFTLDLRGAKAVKGKIQIVATPWPDKRLTHD